MRSDVDSAHEERPAAIEHRRRRQHQLQVLLRARREEGQEVEAEDVLRHLQDEQDQRQRPGDPQPPCHVDEFRIGPLVACRHHRLERHAADRARSRAVPDDLRMHWAGVLGARRCGRRGAAAMTVMVMLMVPVPAARLRLEVLVRVGGKLGSTALGAEMISDAVMILRRLALGEVDSHPADRIGRGPLGSGAVDVSGAGHRGLFSLL